MKVYLSGMITGLSEERYKELFRIAEMEMIAFGNEVVNPIALEHKSCDNWQTCMLTCIKALFDCEGIYMLNNWKLSKGARIEHCIAIEMGKKVYYQ